MKNICKKLIAVVSVFLLLILCSFVFLFLPSARTVKNILAELKVQKNFLEKIDKHREQLNLLKSNWIGNNENLKRMNARLVLEDDLVDLVVVLEDLAERMSVEQEITVIRASSAKVEREKNSASDQNQTNQKKEILFGDDIAGSFENIMQYIKGVENLRYLVEIDSCRFSKERELIKANLALRIPVYNESL